MKNLLKSFYQLFKQNEEFQQKVGAYDRALKTEEWKFLKDTIYVIKGEMLSEMFSQHHTELSATEKDILQRTYYNVNRIMDYLLNPMGWIKNRDALMKTLTAKPTRKER
jgi:hypothetical protein